MVTFELLVKLQVYIFSFLMLLILYVQLISEGEGYILPQRLFKALILSTMVTMSMEAVSWVFDGRPGQTARLVATTSNVLLLAFNIIPLVALMLYLDFRIHNDIRRTKKSAIPLGLLAMLNSLLALTAPINGLYFYMDTNNLYHRGDWAPIAITVYLALFGYAILLVLGNWRRLQQKGRVPLLLSLFPPLIGFYLQAKYYGVGLVWVGVSLSILIMYITIQNQTIKTDYLTGLYNRRQLDYHLENRIKNLQRKQQFAGIMIDINGLKQINDTHGHLIGDRAIEATALALKHAFRNDFIARYAGDEFVVLLDLDNAEDLDAMVTDLNMQFAALSARKKDPFELQISAGYAVYQSGSGQSPDKFLNKLDELMYERKLSNRPARESDSRQD